jgi:hypothetical protein
VAFPKKLVFVNNILLGERDYIILQNKARSLKARNSPVCRDFSGKNTVFVSDRRVAEDSVSQEKTLVFIHTSNATE